MRWRRFAVGRALGLLVLVVLALPGALTASGSGGGVGGRSGDVSSAVVADGAEWAEAGWADAGATLDGWLAFLDDREAAAGPQPAGGGFPAVAPQSMRRAGSSARRVGIQAGHWKSWELPPELAMLRTSTGTAGGGVREWELNLSVARRVAALLQAQGVAVDLLPATVPARYQADAFVAIHADGEWSRRLSGYKLARARWSAIPRTDDALLAAIAREYGAATRLRVDWHVTRNMTAYYAFNSGRFQHAVASTTPAVILEMGFMTNSSDLRLLLTRQDTMAQGIARGILSFLSTRGK